MLVQPLMELLEGAANAGESDLHISFTRLVYYSGARVDEVAVPGPTGQGPLRSRNWYLLGDARHGE